MKTKNRGQENGRFCRFALSHVSRPSGAFCHSDGVLYSSCLLRLIRGISGGGFFPFQRGLVSVVFSAGDDGSVIQENGIGGGG